jgi:hypothetical protein
MNVVIIQRLIIIVGAVAILSFCARRKWLTPIETALVGGAMIFAATGWILQAVLNITIADFPDRKSAVIVGVLVTLPLVLSLTVGLITLVRKLKRESSDTILSSESGR